MLLQRSENFLNQNLMQCNKNQFEVIFKSVVVVSGSAAGEELNGAVPRKLEGQVVAIGPMRLLPLYAAKPETRARCV